jgi:hypothetical protein
LAVTVVSAFNVIAQVTVLVEAHPDQEEKTLEPTMAGAVSVNEAPKSSVWEKLVVT